MEGSLRAKCPACSGELILRRISDINVAEYRASCESCGWKGSMKSLQCGDCHGRSLFKWTDKGWSCTRCGNVRTDPSPPKIERTKRR